MNSKLYWRRKKAPRIPSDIEQNRKTPASNAGGNRNIGGGKEEMRLI